MGLGGYCWSQGKNLGVVNDEGTQHPGSARSSPQPISAIMSDVRDLPRLESRLEVTCAWLEPSPHKRESAECTPIVVEINGPGWTQYGAELG